MPEHLARLSDDDLGLALAALAGDLDVPVGIDVAARVGVVLRRAPAAPRVRARGWLARLLPARPIRRALVIAFAFLVLLAGAAVAGRLGVPGLKLIFGDDTTASPPPPVTTPSVPPERSELFVGIPTTLAEARREVRFDVAVPHDPALPPAEVYRSSTPPGGRVTFIYPRVPGIPASRFSGVSVLVTEFDGTINPEFVEKFVDQGLHVRQVKVGTETGYWIGGPPHEVILTDRNGEPFQESIRLAGPTLVFQRGDLTIRVEGDMTLRRAQEIARSIR